MAYPVANSYSAASGQTKYAGRPQPGLTGDGVQFGDSLTALSYGSQPARWSDPLTRHPPRMVYNAGVPNHTLLDLIGRAAADVLSRSPSFVDLRAGTNSLGVATATFRAQYRQLLDLLLTGTDFILVRAIPPNNTVGAAIVAHNTWLQAQCAADPAHLAYVGDCDSLGDTSYNSKSTHFLDGIHLNAVGQHSAGVDGVPFLLPHYTTDPRLLDASDKYPSNPTSNQYVKNPHMSGTAGTKGSGVTGTVPTDWNVSCAGSGATAIASIITDFAGDIPWLRMQLVSSGGVHYVTASTRLAHPAIAADGTIKRFDSVVEARLVGVNSAQCKEIDLNVDAAGVNIGGFLQLLMADFGVLNDTMVLRHAYERIQGSNGTVSGNVALAAYAENTLDLNIGIGFSGAFTGGTGFLDIRCASVRGSTT